MTDKEIKLSGYLPKEYEIVVSSDDYMLVQGFLGKEIPQSYSIGTRVIFSWNDLIPMAEKINAICNEHGFELSNHSRDQEHLSNQLDNPLHWKSWSYHYVHLSTKIDQVFKSVVDFIEWYNNTQKSELPEPPK